MVGVNSVQSEGGNAGEVGVVVLMELVQIGFGEEAAEQSSSVDITLLSFWIGGALLEFVPLRSLMFRLSG